MRCLRAGLVVAVGLAIFCAAASPAGAATPQARDLSAIGVLIVRNQDLTALNPKVHAYFRCTASVVRSSYGDVVLTAGHCAWGGLLFDQFAFAPGFRGKFCTLHYRRIGGRKVPFIGPTRVTQTMPPAAFLKCGSTPHGIWTNVGLPVTSYRGSSASNGYRGRKTDYAFLTMARQGGRTIASVVGGGLPIAFGQPQAQIWVAYGLSKSDTLHYCTARAKATAVGPEMDCAHHPDLLLGGDSGGPWIDASGDVGAVNSQVGGHTLAGALLDPAARRAYDEASTFPQIYFRIDTGHTYPCNCDFGAANAPTEAVVRPATLFPALVNPPWAANLRSWTYWGAATTSSTGTLYYDTCSPACVNGYHHTAGRATLSDVRDCSGSLYYLKVSFTYFTKPKYDSTFSVDCRGKFTAIAVHGH